MTEQELKDLEMVKENADTLYYVKNQTEEVCLAAVKQDGWALQFVNNQTEPVCLAAVKQYCGSLYLVKNQTENIVLEAANNTKGRLIIRIKFNKIWYLNTNQKELNKDANNPFLF